MAGGQIGRSSRSNQRLSRGADQMSQDQQAARKTCIVHPPQPEDVQTEFQFISVEVADDEDVQWHWTYTADGKRIVSGFTIIKKPDTTA
jgi:hypothetical protein